MHAIYGSDFSIGGAHDAEFGAAVAWGAGLLEGYSHSVLAPVRQGGPTLADDVTGEGIAAELQACRPRAVLVQGYATPFERRALRAALASGVPVLLRAETTDHALTRSPARSLARDMALRWLYRRTAAALYIGQRSRAHYERLGVLSHRLFRAPYGVETAPFETDEAARARLRDVTRAHWDLPENDPVALYVGKLSSRKGVDVLLDAAAHLRSGGVSLRVLLVGDGDQRAALEGQAERLGVPLHITGVQPQAALSAFYHAADVFVLPSRRGETWGLVVNEALHHGVPVVVSDAVGCAPDLAVPGKTGVTVPANDAAALAAGLATVLGDTGAARRAVCRDTVGEYTLDHAADGIVRAVEATT